MNKVAGIVYSADDQCNMTFDGDASLCRVQITLSLVTMGPDKQSFTCADPDWGSGPPLENSQSYSVS